MPPDDLGEASALDMAVIEANALALGLSVDALMENAGRAVAEEAAAHLPASGRVVILAGVGNNGGDGTCAAFYLGQWGFRPEIWLVRPPSEIRGASARRCWERVRTRCPTHVGVPTGDALHGADLLVDALLGSGQTGELRSPFRETVDTATRSGVPTLSIDLPTGLGAATGIRPRWSVALTQRKHGMSEGNSGAITVRDIGIPPAARSETGPGEFLRFPRPVGSVQARHGRVLVIGGGPYSGAPALAALAALRAGAERATVAAPSPAAEAVRALSPDLIVRTVGEGSFAQTDAGRLRELVEESRADAVVVGMGAGRAAGTIDALRALLNGIRGSRPIVVDADALDALDRVPGGAGHLVATPNAPEYHRVFTPDAARSAEDQLAIAHRRALEWGVTLLAKGEPDLITDGTRGVLNRHHHPAATVSGVGDVLAGVVGGLLAQGLAPMDAARLGAYWVGDAGQRAAELR
ncbi:MAG: NAD(P)H-hydrate dehydratase, partial [Thermoplasmata archaeon]|nr:NAD(P)H-hydrate dehydratase [Thermoplasmata archaeon]